jgi:hypothetical protein
MIFSRSRILLTALRLGLGAMYVYAAWTKLREPWAVFAMQVDAYRVLPYWAVVTVARVLPWAELALGLVLISGFFLRVSSALSSALLGFFIALLAQAYLKGLRIDCGCFGSGDTLSARTLARDGALLAASLAMTALALRRRRATPVPPSATESTPCPPR